MKSSAKTDVEMKSLLCEADSGEPVQVCCARLSEISSQFMPCGSRSLDLVIKKL